MTMPQIIMLNHASHVNHTRAKSGSEVKQKGNSNAIPESYKSEETPKFRGKPIDQLTAEEYQTYMSS